MGHDAIFFEDSCIFIYTLINSVQYGTVDVIDTHLVATVCKITYWLLFKCIYLYIYLVFNIYVFVVVLILPAILMPKVPAPITLVRTILFVCLLRIGPIGS